MIRDLHYRHITMMMKEEQNIFVINVDMEKRRPEEIAREAALKIIVITDNLVEAKKEQELKKS